MPSEPITIKSMLLRGFRAYLDPKAFDFSKQRSLAIFAPNGYGKSSLIDALEFFFSEDGTLKRLGVRAVHNNAGVHALAHNLAGDRKIPPGVVITFREGAKNFTGSREAAGTVRAKPDEAQAVGNRFVVNPIIRGYELRKFVEGETAEERYESVVNWLQLGPLVEAQRNLRSLRQNLKAASEDDSSLLRIDRELQRQTAKTLAKWDSEAILAYVGKDILAPLDATLACAALSKSDGAYVAVAERAAAEEKRLGLEGLRQIEATLATLYDETVDPADKSVTIHGLIPSFVLAINNKTTTAKRLKEEQAAAAEAVFAAVWREAAPLFADDKKPLEDCPICLTPIALSAVGSHAGVRTHLANHLAELKEYSDAKKADEAASKDVSKLHTGLIASLRALKLPDDYKEAREQLGTFGATLKDWDSGHQIDDWSVTTVIAGTLADVRKRIQTIVDKQGDHTYIKAQARLDALVELERERVQAIRTLEELVKLSTALNAQSAIVSSNIRSHVQSLLDGLRLQINSLYKAIQGEASASIRLELPAEDDTNQQRLNLLIDFAENRKGVQPGGYLSDSQIHSLALALRLSAIKSFNLGAPFVALDDVVTSYDADHRRTVAGLIAKEMSEFQVIVVTHDERFYLYLRDQLSSADWRFMRIVKLDKNYGPRFSDEKLSDDAIAARWDEGNSAANEMRQAEEEWLLGICRDFGVNIRIRPLEKAFSFERSELASALASFLKGAKLDPPSVPGVNNRFLTSLQQGVVENFGSHFQDAPYGDGSQGDEKTRWAEFVAFRSHFACACKHTRFLRPHGLDKPLCQKCQKPFAFQ